MNVRAAAAEVIAKVLRGQSLSALLPDYSDRVDEKDRALLKQMCFGTMRWYPQIAILLKELLTKPLRDKDLEIQGLLACGLYQLMYMRIAEHAVINETVSAPLPWLVSPPSTFRPWSLFLNSWKRSPPLLFSLTFPYPSARTRCGGRRRIEADAQGSSFRPEECGFSFQAQDRCGLRRVRTMSGFHRHSGEGGR